MQASGKVTDKSQVKTKAERFCAYQERSQQEVRDKLYSFGLHSAEVEELISDLVSSNFLNEERFAKAYVSGKFRMKHWGKNKIKQGLRLKKVPEKLINKVLGQINEEEYRKTLEILLKKKSALLRERDPYKLNYKLMQYGAGKGYEQDLISKVIKGTSGRSVPLRPEE